MEKEIKRILNEYSLNKEMTLEDATQQILRLFSVMNWLPLTFGREHIPIRSETL